MKHTYLHVYMDPALAGAIIGGGTSLIGDITGMFGQSAANRQTQAYNEKMQNTQRSWALQDIKDQNAYNSPSAQMARLKQAGLNPNLVYGQGVQGATGGQSAQPRSAPAPSYNPQSITSGFKDLGSQAGGALQLGQSLQQMQAQTNLLGENIKTQQLAQLQTQAQTENTKADTQNKLLYPTEAGYKFQGMDISNKLGQQKFSQSASMFPYSMDMTKQQIQDISLKNLMTQKQLDWYDLQQQLAAASSRAGTARTKAETGYTSANTDFLLKYKEPQTTADTAHTMQNIAIGKQTEKGKELQNTYDATRNFYQDHGINWEKDNLVQRQLSAITQKMGGKWKY